MQIRRVDKSFERCKRSALKWIDRLLDLRTGPTQSEMEDEVNNYLFLLGLHEKRASDLTVEELYQLRNTVSDLKG